MIYENLFYIPDRMIFGYPYSSTKMEWRLHRVVPAVTVTTHAKPYAQQQLARDLEVDRAAASATAKIKLKTFITSRTE